LGIIEKRGSFYSFADVRLGQGRENAKDYLRQNPGLSDEIELTIRQQAFSGALPMPMNGSDESEFGNEEEL
jgi:recombination protein RecA